MRNPETAQRLLEAMNRKNMTAKQLSDKSGVSEPSISQYIHGLFAPRNKTAAKLADVLNVNPMWLMGFDVPMKEQPKAPTDFSSILVGTDVSNADFVMDMDLLSRDMTVEQMDNILTFAKFIKSKKDDDNKKEE